ncbi:hypothetical protein GN956_G4514 [Arapaima gigas]
MDFDRQSRTGEELRIRGPEDPGSLAVLRGAAAGTAELPRTSTCRKREAGGAGGPHRVQMEENSSRDPRTREHSSAGHWHSTALERETSGSQGETSLLSQRSSVTAKVSSPARAQLAPSRLRSHGGKTRCC